MNYEITMAFSDYMTNGALAEIANECFQEVGPPAWDEEDYKLAKEFLLSYNKTTLASIKEKITDIYGEDKLEEILEKPLDSLVHPYDSENKRYESGSTDGKILRKKAWAHKSSSFQNVIP